MSNIKLFWLREDAVKKEIKLEELPGEDRPLNPALRLLIEKNLADILGIRVLASNYPLHSNQDERIPTLGLDENDRPVIVHYGSSESTLNQGLFYLNWLLDHRADFNLLVYLQLGAETNGAVQWHMPRLVCLSERVASYALHTAAQSAITVEMLRYRFHGANLLLIERLSPPLRQEELHAETLLRLNALLKNADTALQRLYLTLQQSLFSLTNDLELIVREKMIIFRRLRNVVTVQILGRHLALYLNLGLDQISLEEMAPDFIRDVEGKTPVGVGRVEILLENVEQLTHVLPLIQRSVELG